MQFLLSSSAGIIGSRFADVLGEKHNVLILESFELQIRAMDKSDYLTGTCSNRERSPEGDVLNMRKGVSIGAE